MKQNSTYFHLFHKLLLHCLSIFNNCTNVYCPVITNALYAAHMSRRSNLQRQVSSRSDSIFAGANSVTMSAISALQLGHQIHIIHCGVLCSIINHSVTFDNEVNPFSKLHKNPLTTVFRNPAEQSDVENTQTSSISGPPCFTSTTTTIF